MQLKKLIPLSVLLASCSISNTFASSKDNALYKTKNYLQKQNANYVLGASLGYSYFSKKDLDINYVRAIDNGADEISINKRYKNPTLGLLFGVNTSVESYKYLSSVFYGLKAVYFEGTSKGDMVPLKDKDFKCSDSSAKLPLKSLNVLLNSKLYFNYEKKGIRPFVEAGLGANFYALGLKVTGDLDQFDTKLKDNKKTAFAYNLGLGLTKEFNNNWHGSIAYNYYGSDDLKTKKSASYGLDLAKAVKPKYQNNNISIEIQKHFAV